MRRDGTLAGISPLDPGGKPLVKSADGSWRVEVPAGGGLRLSYRLGIEPRALTTPLGRVRPMRVGEGAEQRFVRRQEAWLLEGADTFPVFPDLEHARYRVKVHGPADRPARSSLPGDAFVDAETLTGSVLLIGAPSKQETIREDLQLIIAGRSPRPDQLQALIDALRGLDRALRLPPPPGRRSILLALRRGPLQARAHRHGILLQCNSARLGSKGLQALAQAMAAGRLRLDSQIPGPDRGRADLAWFWFGARDWLADLALLRSGLLESEDYWTTELPRILTRAHQHLVPDAATATMASRQLWTSPRGRRFPDLSSWGYVTCQLLDLQMRAGQAPGCDLATLCQKLLEMEPPPGDLDALLAAVGKLCPAQATTLLRSAAADTRPLPVASAYARLGLRTRIRARGQKDQERPPRFLIELDPDASEAARERRATLGRQ